MPTETNEINSIGHFHFSKVKWVTFSISACFFFGFSSFLLGEVSQEGLKSKLILSIGYLAVGLGTFAIIGINESKKAASAGISKALAFRQHIKFQKINSFYDRLEEEYLVGNIAGVFLCAALNAGGELCTIYAFNRSWEAGVNQGIIASVISCSAPLIIIGSVFFFKESVQLCEFLGSICMLGGVALLAFSYDLDNE